jgi:hypothetical protein
MASHSKTKPVSRATKSVALRNLKCFPELHKRLIDQGQSLRATAKWLREEQGVLTEMSNEALVKALQDYRASVPAAQRAKPMNVVVERAAEEISKGMDELKEMERLYEMQMARIEIDFQTEKNIKKLLPTMTQEIRTAREILSASAQLKMDLGLNERHLGKVDVETTLLSDVAEKYADSPAVAKVLDDGESRRKVLGLAERLLAIADRAERHPEVADQLDALAEGSGEGESEAV